MFKTQLRTGCRIQGSGVLEFRTYFFRVWDLRFWPVSACVPLALHTNYVQA